MLFLENLRSKSVNGDFATVSGGSVLTLALVELAGFYDFKAGVHS
jgi:hypothetical protein